MDRAIPINSCCSRHVCPRGTTLLEMIIATAIVAVLMVAIAMFVGVQGRVTADELVEFRLQNDIRRALEVVQIELSDCRLAGLANDGMWVSYRVPDRNAGGAPRLNKEGQFSWGAIDDNSGLFLPGGCHTLIFLRADGTEVRETTINQDINGDGEKTDIFLSQVLPNINTVSENIIHQDLNFDGDTNDIYIPGGLYRYTFNSTGAQVSQRMVAKLYIKLRASDDAADFVHAMFICRQYRTTAVAGNVQITIESSQADCESFTDHNNNNVCDGSSEVPQRDSIRSNKRYEAWLRIDMCGLEQIKDRYRLRPVQTRIALRNMWLL